MPMFSLTRQVVEQPEVLVDHARPRRHGRPPTGRAAERLPVHGEAHPGVGRVVAGQDLDQGRLPGAVLADEGVDLARLARRASIAKHRGGAERLADAVCFQASGVVMALSTPQAVRKAP